MPCQSQKEESTETFTVLKMVGLSDARMAGMAEMAMPLRIALKEIYAAEIPVAERRLLGRAVAGHARLATAGTRLPGRVKRLFLDRNFGWLSQAGPDVHVRLWPEHGLSVGADVTFALATDGCGRDTAVDVRDAPAPFPPP